MNFKNYFKIVLLVIMIWFTLPAQSTVPVTHPVTDTTADLRLLTAITNRVAEIQNMDKSELTASDKKALTRELKEMKKAADGLDDKVYLSIGAIIIIILLLILILR
jgi:hypothetical protein